jgi:RimJ/RimL family protein N-acetyltransferase
MARYLRLMRFPGVVRIEGDGLILREWSMDDLSAMMELFDEESIDRWTPLASPFDRSAAEQYVIRAERVRIAEHGVQLAITTDGRMPLGEILLFDSGRPDEGELAYAVGVAHRGAHLGGRAARLLMAHARSHLGITSFSARISEANPASERVAIDAGLTRTDEPLEIRERKGYRIELAGWRTPVPSGG